jgi:hypothetical protein
MNVPLVRAIAVARADAGQRPRFLTFLINLDRAEDRLASMVDQLDALEMPFERISAVDGKALQLVAQTYDEAGYRRRHGRLTNPGEVGCYLSHVECARRLLDSSHEFALVLEDDLVLPDNLSVVIDEALAEHSHWDVLRLSWPAYQSGRGRLLSQPIAAHPSAKHARTCSNVFLDTRAPVRRGSFASNNRPAGRGRLHPSRHGDRRFRLSICRHRVALAGVLPVKAVIHAALPECCLKSGCM